jgi:hypothetical protein
VSISEDIRQQVRERANFACEYCGVTETDTGGELTVDHFQPRVCGGTDDLDNLLYCCYRCNQYKADYWPAQPEHPALWNPRRETIAGHLLLLADGTLYPISAMGEFTLKRLRLNRPALVALRLRKSARAEEQHLLTRYRDLLALLQQVHDQHAALLSEHRALLEEQRALLRLLLKRSE